MDKTTTHIGVPRIQFAYRFCIHSGIAFFMHGPPTANTPTANELAIHGLNCFESFILGPVPQRPVLFRHLALMTPTVSKHLDSLHGQVLKKAWAL
jgi:hypothetical protein